MFNRLAQRRAKRAFMLKLRIVELEKSNGQQLSYPELDLPTIKVVRNPNGYEWEPWVAHGFQGMPLYGETKKECIEKAKERLWQIALARSEQAEEVHL